MSYVKPFLLCLLVIWLIGFVYVFFGEGKDRMDDAASSNKLLSSNENGAHNVRQLESKLRKLQEKNYRNERLIKELEYVEAVLLFRFGFLYE